MFGTRYICLLRQLMYLGTHKTFFWPNQNEPKIVTQEHHHSDPGAVGSLHMLRRLPQGDPFFEANSAALRHFICTKQRFSMISYNGRCMCDNECKNLYCQDSWLSCSTFWTQLKVKYAEQKNIYLKLIWILIMTI